MADGSVCGAHLWALREVDRQADILDPGHLRRVTDEHGILAPADRREYVTRAERDGIPAGTPCIVSRPNGDMMLRLEFACGRVVWTVGYAAGIEWRLEHAIRVHHALNKMEAAEERARDEAAHRDREEPK